MRNINSAKYQKVNTEIPPDTLSLLKAKKEFPTVSILLPVNKQYPKIREEERKIKAMVAKAEDKLRKELSAKMAASIIQKLHKTVSTVDFSHLSQSLALFVSPAVQKVIHLNFPVEEKLIIGRTFELRDLLFAAKNMFYYWVLALSEKKARLFSGYNYSLAEEEIDMPYGMDDTGGKGHSRVVTFSSASSQKNVSDVFEFREKKIEKYILDLDKILNETFKKGYAPIILCGERKLTDKFSAISKNEDSIIGNIEGNFDLATEYEISQKIEPLLRGKLKKDAEKTMALLEDAVSKKTCASGIKDVWKTVMEKRGRLLIVEKDYHCPGKIGNNKYTLITQDLEEDGSHIFPDAVDDIIELTLTYGGDVVFVNNGALQEHQRIAMITYYA